MNNHPLDRLPVISVYHMSLLQSWTNVASASDLVVRCFLKNYKSKSVVFMFNMFCRKHGWILISDTSSTSQSIRVHHVSTLSGKANPGLMGALAAQLLTSAEPPESESVQT